MAKRVDSVESQFYAPFRNRVRANNPNENRQATIEYMYRRILTELCMNRFEWIGMPLSVDVRYLEKMLFTYALAVYFRDENTGRDFAIQGSPSGQLDLTENPLAFTLTGPGFQGKRVTSAQCVPIWSNYLRTPDLDIVSVYAFRLAEIDRTIEINTMNARRTKMLVYDENSQLTMQNVNRMISSGEAVIPMKMDLTDRITAIDLGVDPDGIEKLSILRSRLWSEAMGLLGINNANQDKKERLVASEVSANDDQVLAIRQVNLNARQAAARKISLMFDLDVRVDFFKATEPNAAIVGEPGGVE